MTDRAILITGAGGFVGSHLAMGFAALGDRVTAVDSAFDEGARRRLAGVTLVETDLCTDPMLPDLGPGSVVIHAAALTTAPEAMGMTEAAHASANMLPLLAMLRHAAKVRVGAFVFLSSSGVFAPGDGSPDLADSDAPTAVGPYSAAKRAGEILVPSALPGIRTYCLRLGYLYGPDEAARPTRQRVSLMQDWVDRAARGEPIDVADPAPRRDWTFVPDLAPAIDRLLGGPGDPVPRHLCAPVAVSDAEVAALLVREYPGLTLRRVPSPGVKAPMRPSPLAALEGFPWTNVATGLSRIVKATA